MAMFGEHAAHEPGRADNIRASIVSGGSLALAIGGAAAVILGILGLLDVWPIWMLTVITIIVGAALVMEGVAIAGRQLQLLSRTGGTIEQTELAGGLTAEFLAGCAGITLGIIALFDVYPIILTACALIIFGSTLVFGARSRPQFNESVESYRGGWRSDVGRADVGRTDLPRTDLPRTDVSGVEPSSTADRPLEQAAMLLSPVYGAHVMVGLACIALGVCALADLRPVVLTLCGMMAVGFVLFLSGTSLATRFLYRLARRQA